MSQEFLVDVHVIYNDNGEEQLIFLTNKRRFTRFFRKHDALISVLLGLLAMTHKIEDALQIRVAEQRNAPVQSDQGGQSSEAKCTTERLCPVHNIWHAARPKRSDGG